MSKPLFIFSASWRTGSTLLQRLLNTDSDLLVWGEPQLLSYLKQMLSVGEKYFSQNQWVRDEVNSKPIYDCWTPTLTPDSSDLLEALRLMFERIYLVPALKKGRRRWGFKEVREAAVANAGMMKKLFPDAKIIFLYRDPYDTYASMKKTDFHKNFKEPFQPMQVWTKNMVDFYSPQTKPLDAFFVKYEDLVSEDESTREPLLHDLFSYAELNLNQLSRQTLQLKLGGTSDGMPLEKTEITKINQIVEKHKLDFERFYQRRI